MKRQGLFAKIVAFLGIVAACLCGVVSDIRADEPVAKTLTRQSSQARTQLSTATQESSTNPATSPATGPTPGKQSELATRLTSCHQKILAEVAAWQTTRQQVERLTLECDPNWLAVVDQVIAALQKEIAAHEKLNEADLAILDDADLNPSQPIYPVRPFHDLAAETAYADKMLAVYQREAQAAPTELERQSKLALAWKASASQDPAMAPLIDRWLELSHAHAKLQGDVVTAYSHRDQPGWYDRASVLDKFDCPIASTEERATRQEIGLWQAFVKQPPEAAQKIALKSKIEQLRCQAKAIIAVHQAGKATYTAITRFDGLMTWESPLVAPTASTGPAVAASPWNLDRLSVPPRVRWLDDANTVRSLLYRGESYQGKGTDVFAYYATPGSLRGDPNLDKSLPAVVLVHGGGDRATREWVVYWAQHGYAAIAMDLAGQGPTLDGAYDKLFKPERLPRGGPGQDGVRKILDINLPLSDQWPYHAVANVVLAHSLVRSLPGVDANRTAVAGISWGGYLTAIVAGVDPRFKAAMPFYGCGFLAENSIWKDNGLFDKLTAEERERWTQLWDPASYAGQIKIPVFAITGAQDFAYPLESFAKTYSLPAGPVQFRITPTMAHGGQFMVQTPEAVTFLDHVLRGGPALPQLQRPQVTADQVTAKTRGELTKAQFYYTTAAGPSKTRAWVSADATIAGQQITVPRPPGDARFAYFTAIDRRGQTVSSELIVFEQQPKP